MKLPSNNRIDMMEKILINGLNVNRSRSSHAGFGQPVDGVQVHHAVAEPHPALLGGNNWVQRERQRFAAEASLPFGDALN